MGEVVDGYNEAPVAEDMKGQNIEIEVDVGVQRVKVPVLPRFDQISPMATSLLPPITVLIRVVCRWGGLAADGLPLKLVVAAALVDIDNRVLIGKRPGGQSHGGPLGISRW